MMYDDNVYSRNIRLQLHCKKCGALFDTAECQSHFYLGD